MGKLFLGFTVITLVELGLLIQFGIWVGLWPTVALVLVTAYVGAYLARREGTKAMNKIRTDLQEYRLPTDAVLDGAFVLVAAALLVTPGILTDIVGFLFLIPVTRFPLRAQAKRWLKKRVETGAIKVQMGAANRGSAGPIVDVTEFEDVTDHESAI